MFGKYKHSYLLFVSHFNECWHIYGWIFCNPRFSIKVKFWNAGHDLKMSFQENVIVNVPKQVQRKQSHTGASPKQFPKSFSQAQDIRPNKLNFITLN